MDAKTTVTLVEWLYAKSAYIYLQTMSNLQETHPQVYAKFQEGYHVVRRSDRL